MAPKRRLQVEFDYAAAARLVLDSYLEFLNSPVPASERGDSKAFAARHTAARSALTHLEHIEKRAEASGDPDQHRAVSNILEEARRHIAAEASDDMEAPDDDAGGDA
ncbi:hypothetical protein [Paracraurococcus lichenis]|uniref:Terminase small subunit n=1 Tax=Paracraurococcus lichenis TaxID=3064888 RepID=A0ABT9DXR7_9PROT|nr:hypothetical protein [Paracraurococcus sp. LOR1-02]MDO9708689.1 hypothetical protein [Paracraurococcus sp. LOR1-02]